jgi:hypothetical protein
MDDMYDARGDDADGGGEVDSDTQVQVQDSDEIALHAMRSFVASNRVNPSNSVEQTMADRKNRACFFCHKPGHIAADCSTRKEQKNK